MLLLTILKNQSNLCKNDDFVMIIIQLHVFISSASDMEDTVMANIRNLMAAAIKKRLMAERRIGCLLSGVYLERGESSL
jgi:asparagine synthetase B (glutamine-hydrolysing)